MNAMPSRTEFERFRLLVAARLGLHHDDGRSDFLNEVLLRRMESTGCANASAYLERLQSRSNRDIDERRALAEQLTVGETYFFRNADHFRAFSDSVLPELLQSRAATRRLRILSCGCASGEEPYSLAIALREAAPVLDSWDVRVVGVDVNAASLSKAARGRYSAWSLRATSPERLRAYFRADGGEFVLDPAIRAMVTFEERNLIDDDWELISERFDVVFCRNVIMYFTPEAMWRVVGRITESLGAGGYLFLGHAETLRGLSNDFHLCHTHDTFYYQRRAATDDLLATSEGERQRANPSVFVEVPVEADGESSWIDVIHRATERIATLIESGSRRAGSIGAPGARSGRPRDFDLVLEAMRQERYADALTLLGSPPLEAETDTDALLIRAVLLANSGALADAERTCVRLLALDELNAGAHYVVALCREHEGDQIGAVEHDQIANYLDSSFAMPHVHQGLMARRAGDEETAQRELQRAQTLLAREDSARLLLFGGGFSRDALLQLCRTALESVGGAA